MSLCRLDGSASAHHLPRSRDDFRRIFRNNLNVPPCASGDNGRAERGQLSSQTSALQVDELLSELAAQSEHWITAENAPQ